MNFDSFIKNIDGIAVNQIWPKIGRFDRMASAFRCISPIYRYRVHKYGPTENDTFRGTQHSSGISLEFKCTEKKDCYLCKRNHDVAFKRGFAAAIDREDDDAVVIDLDAVKLRAIEKVTAMAGYENVEHYDMTFTPVMFGPGYTVSVGPKGLLEEEDLEFKMALHSDWNDSYLQNILAIEDVILPITKIKLTLPDGNDGMRCFRCLNDFSYVEPNQDDGSFVCRSCLSWI